MSRCYLLYWLSLFASLFRSMYILYLIYILYCLYWKSKRLCKLILYIARVYLRLLYVPSLHVLQRLLCFASFVSNLVQFLLGWNTDLFYIPGNDKPLQNSVIIVVYLWCEKVINKELKNSFVRLHCARLRTHICE